MRSDLSRHSPWDACKAVKPANQHRKGHDAGKPIQKMLSERTR
jgi:hypothetical protein